MEMEMEMALRQQSRGGVAEWRPGPRPAAKQEQEPEPEPEQRAGGEHHQEALRRGPWTVDEDLALINYIADHGEGRWNALARAAGLHRTGKSCRLRWLNYLRPDVKRGDFTADEQLLILDLHSRWGNRWSKIAAHLPGRTDNEIKNYWRTRVQKHAKQLNCDVNSKRFKDAMRFLWMPRLAERAAAAASGGAGAGDGAFDMYSSNTQAALKTDISSSSYDRRSPASSSSTTTTSSSLTFDQSAATTTARAAGAAPPAASGDGGWAAMQQLGDQEFWSTASALQHLTAAADHRSSCCFQDQDDLLGGWVQGFADGAIIASSSDNLWSLDDIWRMP